MPLAGNDRTPDHSLVERVTGLVAEALLQFKIKQLVKEIYLSPYSVKYENNPETFSTMPVHG